MIYSFTLALLVIVVVVVVVVVVVAADGSSHSCSSSVAESVEGVVRVIPSLMRVIASVCVCVLVDVVTCTMDSTWYHDVLR